MNRSSLTVFALLAILALSVGAAAQGPQSSPNAEAEILFFGNDPSGDGVAACSVADCQVCNYNGLMCTPTATGCNCDFWPQEQAQ